MGKESIANQSRRLYPLVEMYREGDSEVLVVFRELNFNGGLL